MNTNLKAFTLVELAIVITIIGLLIGGVLKGQELLDNARMTAAASQLKASDTSAITFKDIYKFYPGDIRDPANFIQGCTTSPCTISGNGDGFVGGVNTSDGDENNNFWLHMSKANLLSGIDPNMTFTTGTRLLANPDFKLGGKFMPVYLDAPVFWNYYADPLRGHYYTTFISDSVGNVGAPPYKEPLALKFDLKIDDGFPGRGDVRILSGQATYNPNGTANVTLILKAGI